MVCVFSWNNLVLPLRTRHPAMQATRATSCCLKLPLATSNAAAQVTWNCSRRSILQHKLRVTTWATWSYLWTPAILQHKLRAVVWVCVILALILSKRDYRLSGVIGKPATQATWKRLAYLELHFDHQPSCNTGNLESPGAASSYV